MSSSLGKRKEREEGQDAPHGSTLFVSNLPYTATSTDLQTLFSDLAPVRSAFVVQEHGTGVSKGVGYVVFSTKEDAQAAHEKLTKEGISIEGRQLRIQWADNKPKDKVRKGEDTTDEPSQKAKAKPRVIHHPQSSAVKDPNATRTIVVSGLPQGIDSKSLWKKMRKYDGADSIEWPLKSSTDEDPTSAHVLFTTSNSAQDAVSKLHAHVFKGSLLSVTLKKRLDTLATNPSKSVDRPEKVGGTPNRASRLIVRNLPWDISEQDLRAIFLPHGPIHSIHIPTVSANPGKDRDKEGHEGENKTAEERKEQKRRRGFAFVWMLSKKDAEQAIEGCNGRVIRAGMAEGIVSEKQKRKKQLREERKQKKMAEKKNGDGDEAMDVDKEVEGGGGGERVIAVDWALSKNKWEEEKAKIQGEAEKDDEEDTPSETEGEGEGEDESALGVHEDGEGDSTDSGDDDEVDDLERDVDEGEQPVKPQLPPPEAGTTLFVRNVPFSATEDDLRTLFRTFGPLRYARITLDPVTGRSRGTGFACFWNKADADTVIDENEKLRAQTATAEQPAKKKNPFTLPSILTPDPSSSLAQRLVLHGRTLDVVRAVTRDEASRLRDEGEKRREKADKRNMYLLREGVILPNTPAASTLTPAELERRAGSFNARRALLRSNPSLYVSRTRLSVRQLPLWASERTLRRLARQAVRAFETEAREGTRTGLTEDELVELAAADEEVAVAEKTKPSGKKKREIKKPTGVKQAKVVRQAERVDGVTGKGRSKGYGFLEMYKHADALRVLRWMNNNPDVVPLLEGLWREEVADLVKSEKQKADGQMDAARLKRLQDELEKLDKKTEEQEGERRPKTLIVEFSIENVQVVKRRETHQKERASNAAEPQKLRDSISFPKGKQKNESEESSPKKKRRVSESAHPPSQTKSEPGKSHIGTLIGRKRKERKGKKGGG